MIPKSGYRFSEKIMLQELRLKVEGETDAEGVERFLQIDAHAARRRTRAARGSSGAAGAAGGQPEGLGVAAEVGVAILAPDLPAGRDLGFPARTNRAANPCIAPGHCSRCRGDGARRRGHAGGTRGGAWAEVEVSGIGERAADLSERNATRHVQQAPG